MEGVGVVIGVVEGGYGEPESARVVDKGEREGEDMFVSHVGMGMVVERRWWVFRLPAIALAL